MEGCSSPCRLQYQGSFQVRSISRATSTLPVALNAQSLTRFPFSHLTGTFLTDTCWSDVWWRPWELWLSQPGNANQTTLGADEATSKSRCCLLSLLSAGRVLSHLQNILTHGNVFGHLRNMERHFSLDIWKPRFIHLFHWHRGNASTLPSGSLFHKGEKADVFFRRLLA